MRLYMCACERCGKEVPATLAGYAKMVLGNSARIDGKARALCPECAESLRAWFLAGAVKPDAPLCEDCWNEQQGHAVVTLRREVRNLRFKNARLREELDAATEETAVRNLRQGIETAYEPNRERALALTKLDECELWLGRC